MQILRSFLFNYYLYIIRLCCDLLQKEAPVVFASGVLKPGVDKEIPNKQKKWASPGTAQGNAVFIPDRFVFFKNG